MITFKETRCNKHYFKITKQVLLNENAKFITYSIHFKNKKQIKEKVRSFKIIKGSMKDIILLFIETMEKIIKDNKSLPAGMSRANIVTIGDFSFSEKYQLSNGSIQSKKDYLFLKEFNETLESLKESLVFR